MTVAIAMHMVPIIVMIRSQMSTANPRPLVLLLPHTLTSLADTMHLVPQQRIDNAVLLGVSLIVTSSADEKKKLKLVMV